MINFSTLMPAWFRICRKVPGPERLVVRNNDSAIRILAAKDHVATLLALENEIISFEGAPASPGQTSRPAASLAGTGKQVHVLAGILLGHRITGQKTVFHVEVNGLTDIRHGLIAAIAL